MFIQNNFYIFKVVSFLPNVNEKPEGEEQTNNVVTHFNTIKRFYQTFQNSGFDPSPEMELFFNSIQIYEV